MSDSQPSEKPARQPLLIQNVFEKETSESFIERNFRDGCLHRCKSVAEFDVNAIAADHHDALVRSSQELELNPNGQGYSPQWTTLIFQKEANVFWHFLIKANNSYGVQDTSRLFTLTVTADSPAKAAADAMMLEKQYTTDENAPGFFLIRDVKKPKRIPLKPDYALSSEMLDLHYGKDFSQWSEAFAAGLNQNGLSILRGSPGTGKTSFLRHLIFSLSATHRFYYVPVDAFGLLHTSMAEFLAKERVRFQERTLVMVLEDAEQLLLNRRELRDGLASSLLNFTDGFVGDMVQAHLICTINSEVKDLDDAVLRPGRQRFFREFGLMDWEQAQALAAKLDVTLTENRQYSLAELYHFKDTQNAERLHKTETRAIGFGIPKT